MAISGMSSASFHASAQQGLQSLSHHKHGGRSGQSLTDVDATGSSVASPPSATGKVGSKLNVTA
jgi:hypothetical protein